MHGSSQYTRGAPIAEDRRLRRLRSVPVSTCICDAASDGIIRAMRIRPFSRVLLVTLFLCSQLTAAPTTAPAADTCLMFAAKNLAKGDGNFYVYCSFADDKVKLAPGDVLEYDVYLDPANPMPVGGIHIDVNDNHDSLRDTPAVDQNHLRAHGDADLSGASGKWYHRRIALDPIAGHTTRG